MILSADTLTLTNMDHFPTVCLNKVVSNGYVCGVEVKDGSALFTERISQMALSAYWILAKNYAVFSLSLTIMRFTFRGLTVSQILLFFKVHCVLCPDWLRMVYSQSPPVQVQNVYWKQVLILAFILQCWTCFSTIWALRVFKQDKKMWEC